MSTRWTDTSAFANAIEIANDDLLPLSDVSAAEGSRQRTLTGAVLRAQVGGASSIGAAPGVGDDSADGYRAGSLVLTPAGALYVCTDASAGAAVWVNLTDAVLNKFDATVAPAAGDDTGDGYAPGSLWVDVTEDKAYICLDATATAAVWTEITAAGGSSTFTALTDTPANYTGHTLKLVRVNAGETALEFVAGAGTGDVVGPASAVDDRIATFDGTTGKLLQDGGVTVASFATTAQGALADSAIQSIPIIVACSDETTALTTGTAKVTFRMPFAGTLDSVKISTTAAPTGSALTVDLNENGTTVLSTKLTIDATEKTSATAATPAVISDAALADDAEMTVDIDGVGSTIAGAGLKLTMMVTPT